MRIGFNLAIFEDHDKWESVLSRRGKTRWPNKAWEVEVHNFGWGNIIDFEFAWTRRTDHAGLRLKLGLFGYLMEATLYDTRHWDSNKGQWQVYDEEYFRSIGAHKDQK